MSSPPRRPLSPPPPLLQQQQQQQQLEEVGEEGFGRNWVELPRDVAGSILLRLGAIEIMTSAQYVCTTWHSICKDPTMWRSIDMRNPGDIWDMEYDLDKMCRHAIDRSSGGLVDINIENFGTDDLLSYITDNTSRLKRLRLVSCDSITDDGLSGLAAKVPLLEELEIYYCSLSKESLEVVGRCCPLLRTLKLNCQGYKLPHIECDEEALAIAETMPRLHHLQIFGNKLTNDGVKVILDGCPHLESLDLRQCFNVNLEGNFGKRCSERIKDLRRPYDPTNDYPFGLEIPDDRSSEEDDYPYGFSDVDFLSDDYDYYEFSGGSDFSDYDGGLFFD